MDAYTGFIPDVKRDNNAIRIASSTKPAFDRFLQVSIICRSHLAIAKYSYLVSAGLNV